VKVNDDSKLIYDSVFGNTIQFVNKVEKKEIDIVMSQIKEVNENNPENCDLNNEYKIVNFFDSPDFYIVFSDFVLAFEHFMIDPSKLTKKGYKYKRKYSEDYYNKIHSDIWEDDVNTSHHIETIDTDLKYQYLLNNFYSIFNKHYKQIEKYNENIRNQIKDKTMPIHTIFFIEYSVKLPSQIFHDGSLIDVFPHNDIRLYDFLYDKNELKGIIVNYDDGRSRNTINRYISLKACKTGFYKIDNDNIFNLTRIGVHDYKNPLMSSTIMKI